MQHECQFSRDANLPVTSDSQDSDLGRTVKAYHGNIIALRWCSKNSKNC